MRPIATCFIAGLLLLAAASAAPAADFGFRGIDLHAGASFPSDWDTGVTAGLSVNVGELTRGLYLYPAVFYSQAEQSEDFLFSQIDLEITGLALGAEVRYFLSGEPSGFYFGGGPYLNRLDLELSAVVAGVPIVVEDEADEVGVIGVAGYRLDLGSVSGALEARYNTVSDFDAAQLLLVLGFGG
jgi:hypothetical protein